MLAFRCSSTRSSCPNARTTFSYEQLKILADHFLLSYYRRKFQKLLIFGLCASTLCQVHQKADRSWRTSSSACKVTGPYTLWFLATVKRKVHSTEVTSHEEFTRGIKDAIFEIQRNSQCPWYANSIVIDVKLRIRPRLLSEPLTTWKCYHVIKRRLTTPTP